MRTATTLLALLFLISTAAAQIPMCGDCTQDDDVSILDALMVAQAAAGIPVGPTPPSCNVYVWTAHDPGDPPQARVSTDLTILDALLIAQYCVGLVTHLDCL